jgi:Flp pilus assembly pilin Flp
MEYVAMAYALIAVVLIGYIVNLWRRMQAVERERESIEAGKD